ncbi:MAG TPA: hypothetical protein PLY34_21070 [Ferruginibacter sp.]|nr:hypothetical protein [Ferruginibacter sp.]
MTPKEKAYKLIKRYSQLNTSGKPLLFTIQESKQCATIAVEEIEATGTLSDRSCGHLSIEPCHKEYWQQVKKEIKLL